MYLLRTPVGPYTIAEGGSVVLNASKSSDEDGDTLVYLWDLNNDGKFGDKTSVNPTVTWAELQALSPTINNDGSYTISVRAFDPSSTFGQASVTLTVTNTLPTANAGDRTSSVLAIH